MKRSLSVLLFLVLLAALLTVPAAAATTGTTTGTAQKYAVDSAHFDAVLNTDGSAVITETWVVRFISGDFTEFYHDISYSGVGDSEEFTVSDVRVWIDGTECTLTSETNYQNRPDWSYYIENDRPGTEIGAHLASSGVTHTYVFQYRLNDVIKCVDNEYDLFTYRFIGAYFSKTIGDLSVTLTVPDVTPTVLYSTGSTASVNGTTVTDHVSDSYGMYKMQVRIDGASIPGAAALSTTGADSTSSSGTAYMETSSGKRSFDSAHFDAVLNTDGSADITETWTISYFSDSFTEFHKNISYAGAKTAEQFTVSDVRVWIDGTECTLTADTKNCPDMTCSVSGDQPGSRITAYLHAESGTTHTYVFRYRLNGVIKCVDNKYDLFTYRFVGSNFTKNIRNFSVTLTVPNGDPSFLDTPDLADKDIIGTTLLCRKEWASGMCKLSIRIDGADIPGAAVISSEDLSESSSWGKLFVPLTVLLPILLLVIHIYRLEHGKGHTIITIFSGRGGSGRGGSGRDGFWGGGGGSGCGGGGFGCGGGGGGCGGGGAR